VSTEGMQPDNSWWMFKGDGRAYGVDAAKLDRPAIPPSPSWRSFRGLPFARELPPIPQRDAERGAGYEASDEERELVNTALILRRPLLVTGKPGSGKSTLAYAVAWELGLGPVLRWSVTTRSVLQDALYRYDAIARLQEASLIGGKPDIGRFITLGPLGTALIPATSPRVLLIDEIDKGDIDLPNDLLNVLEEGEFEIPELTRLADEQALVEVRPGDGEGMVPVERGVVRCHEFPLIVMTSNGEREFPPAFLRRCLRLTIQQPGADKLARIVQQRIQLSTADQNLASTLIDEFLARRTTQELATDQLLNAIYLMACQVNPLDRTALLNALLRPLAEDEQ
jgi:MoxR-like ATPase